MVINSRKYLYALLFPKQQKKKHCNKVAINQMNNNNRKAKRMQEN